MTAPDMATINNVAAKLGLSVHQLRRWELMFGLEIKRGRGQQRQYRDEDMSVLERIKELVEQGWPTSQIRPQLEAEGLVSPRLIGATPMPGNPEVLLEAIIGLRSFSERRFIDLSKQVDELRQLVISVTLKQELADDRVSPWQPMASEYVPAPKAMPPQEITIGPQISIDPPKSPSQSMMVMPPSRANQIPANPTTNSATGAYSMPPAAGLSDTDFSQRSMLSGSGSNAGGESKTSIPDIDQAPQPITDALQRSMSTLDSLFKDSRNTPGVGLTPNDSTTTAASTSSSSLPAQSQRNSTIPPIPSTPPMAPANLAGQDVDLPSYAVKTSVETPAVGPPEQLTSSANEHKPAEELERQVPAPAAPASAWDQAFSSTSVDINALPSSGLFEEPSAAQPTINQPPSRPPGSSFPPPGQGASAGYSSERNPFTTITGTNTDALNAKPTDTSVPSLMGQTDASSQGFGATAGTASGQNLTQTGPLPSHTSIESFAPELKEQLIESQSDSTSTELPQSQSITTSTSPAAPAPPVSLPALPLAIGPQVNFGPNVSAPTPQATPQRMDDNFGLGEVTDQNYLTVLGRALDLIGWSDEQADSFSLKTFGVPHWDELGRSQAEKLVAHLVGILKDQLTQ